MGGKGFSHLSNVGVGTRNSEGISIGVGEKVWGNVEVKKLDSVVDVQGPYRAVALA